MSIFPIIDYILKTAIVLITVTALATIDYYTKKEWKKYEVKPSTYLKISIIGAIGIPIVHYIAKAIGYTIFALVEEILEGPGKGAVILGILIGDTACLTGYPSSYRGWTQEIFITGTIYEGIIALATPLSQGAITEIGMGRMMVYTTMTNAWYGSVHIPILQFSNGPWLSWLLLHGGIGMAAGLGLWKKTNNIETAEGKEETE